jgi:putative Flp pilus-assembly TadE/G-like protein
LIKVHNRKRRERGQTLIFVLLAMPLFLALIALVIDGSMLLVKKRALQNAADAAALAVVQSAPDPTCTSGCLTSFATDYSQKNGGPDLHPCNDADPTHPTDSNCYRYPYIDKDGNVYDGHAPGFPKEAEVRMTVNSPTIFARAIGLGSVFKVSARSVAQTDPRLGVSPVPGTTVAGILSTQTTPGSVHVSTNMSTVSNGSGIAFAMSGVCNSISYTGSGAGTWDDAIGNGFPGTASVLGALATNGGVNFQGAQPKKITWLGFDQTRCMNAPNHDPDSPPSGTSSCQARAWNTPPGSGTDSNNNCVQTLFNLNQTVAGQPWRPINWPLSPPTVPQPQTGAYDPATYPTKCSDVTSRKSGGGAGTVNVDVSDLATWPAGIYCVTGGTSFQISGADPAASAGHTFFALGGGTISLSSNSTALKYYWPVAKCGPRPQPNDPRQGCVAGYDPYTLLYSTFASANGNCAICLQGQSGNITGDLFATQPNVFPPTPTQTQTGGIVKVSGGALAAGRGFIECWNLQLSGNTGTYQGTGAGIVIPGGVTTTTDPDQVTTLVLPGTTNVGTTIATTIGTDIDLSQ